MKGSGRVKGKGHRLEQEKERETPANITVLDFLYSSWKLVDNIVIELLVNAPT